MIGEKFINKMTGQITGKSKRGLPYFRGGRQTYSQRRSLPWVRGEHLDAREKRRRRMSAAYPECIPTEEDR